MSEAVEERRPVSPEDVVARIVEALHGHSVGGGKLSAVANGHEVNVNAHADTDDDHHNSFNVLVH